MGRDRSAQHIGHRRRCAGFASMSAAGKLASSVQALRGRLVLIGVLSWGLGLLIADALLTQQIVPLSVTASATIASLLALLSLLVLLDAILQRQVWQPIRQLPAWLAGRGAVGAAAPTPALPADFLDSLQAAAILAQPTAAPLTAVTDPASADEIAQLRVQLEAALAAERAKTDHLTRISHELRGPMNAVLGFAQLLQSDARAPLGSEQSANLDELMRAAAQLNESINEALDLSRMVSGEQPRQRAAVEIAPLVDECLRLLGPALEQHGSGVEVTPIAAGTVAMADRKRLRQVLASLLSFAMRNGKPGARLALRCTRRDGAAIALQIQHPAAVLSAEQLQQAFEPLGHARPAVAAVIGGSLGLELCRRAVEAMGGRLQAQINGERVLTLELELESALAVAAGSDPVPTAETAPSGLQRVLYVEDNPTNQRLMQRIFASRPDLELLEASTGSAGIEQATQQHPALILLDLGLPGMDGFQVLQRLREDPRCADIPVLAVTANALPQVVERALAAGFAEYVTKPINVRQLLLSIDRHLQRPATPVGLRALAS